MSAIHAPSADHAAYIDIRRREQRLFARAIDVGDEQAELAGDGKTRVKKIVEARISDRQTVTARARISDRSMRVT